MSGTPVAFEIWCVRKTDEQIKEVMGRMADQKNENRENESNESRGKSTRSGGNMGAGQSGVEGLGTEKAADTLGSHDPDDKVAHKPEPGEKEPNRHEQGH